MEAEKILDGQVAELTKQLLGPNARLFPAQTDTGRYRGEIIAETEHHILQKLSPQSAAAHPKQLLPGNIAVGQNVIVAYANQTAHLQPNQPKAREHSLGR